MATSAAETVAQVLQAQQTHGYRSVSSAIDRLRHASDVPGETAPLQARLQYQSALLALAMQGERMPLAQASMSALERMDKQQGCRPCHFQVLLAKAQNALINTSVAASRLYLEQALALASEIRDPVAQEQLLALRGSIDAVDHKLDLGIKYTMQALELAESRGDAAEAVRLQNALIWIDHALGDLPRAASLGNEAYARAQAMGYRPMMASISLMLGIVYASSGDRVRQRKTTERARTLSADDPDLLSTHILSLNNLSDLYLSEPGQNQRVLDYARQAEALARANNMQMGRAAPLTNMGLALARMGKLDEGIADIRQAIAISQRGGNKGFIVGITRELVGVLERAKRYQGALIELRKVDELTQELTRQQREKAVLELQEKYATERKTQQIEQLSAENALKQAELAAENWRNRLWITLAVMLAVGLVLLILSMRRARRANRHLAVANQTLARQSTIDPLTEAFNRRHTQILLEDLQRTPPGRRNGDDIHEHCTGLLMLDLDYFKHVNDNWGHAAGDNVLATLAWRLRNLMRQGDVLSRWGGEEFVLVLPNTPASALPAIARKVLHAIGDAPVVANDEIIQVTASLGAVSLPMFPGQDWQAALGVADMALYQAKAAGRNRAVCVTALGPHADVDRISRDLAQARQAGEVELTVVTGPASERTATPVPKAISG